MNKQTAAGDQPGSDNERNCDHERNTVMNLIINIYIKKGKNEK